MGEERVKTLIRIVSENKPAHKQESEISNFTLGCLHLNVMSTVYLYPTAPRYQAAVTSLFGDDDEYQLWSPQHLDLCPWSGALRLARAQAQAEAEFEAREYRRRQLQQRAIAAARAKAQAEEELRFYIQQQIREKQRRRQHQIALQQEAERHRTAQLAHQANSFLEAIGQQITQAHHRFEREREIQKALSLFQQQRQRHEEVEARRISEAETSVQQVAAQQARVDAETSTSQQQNNETTSGHAIEDSGELKSALENVLAPFLQALLTQNACRNDASFSKQEPAQAAPAPDNEKGKATILDEVTVSPISKTIREVPIIYRTASPAPTENTTSMPAHASVSAAGNDATAPTDEAAVASAEPELPKAQPAASSDNASDCGSSVTSSSRGRSRSPRHARVSDVDDDGNEIVTPDSDDHVSFGQVESARPTSKDESGV